MPAGMHLQRQLNVRVSDEAHAVVRFYSDYWHISQADALERILREYARADGHKIVDLVKHYAPGR